VSVLKIRKALRALAYARDRRTLSRGVVASLEHSVVLRSLPPAGTILDIGANKGQFILEAVKWHPGANLIAFEPLESERALMEYALAGLSRLTIHPVALGHEDTTAPFHVSSSADCSSILEQTPLQAETFPGTQNAAQVEIPVRRLDHVLDRSVLAGPVICKIDVQGFELNVLRGFGSLLDAVDYLIVELTNIPFYEGAPNSADVVAFLAARSFKILGIYDMYIERGVSLQADFLFGRNAQKKWL
jgi:FkbM family methyltransferase